MFTLIFLAQDEISNTLNMSISWRLSIFSGLVAGCIKSVPGENLSKIFPGEYLSKIFPGEYLSRRPCQSPGSGHRKLRVSRIPFSTSTILMSAVFPCRFKTNCKMNAIRAFLKNTLLELQISAINGKKRQTWETYCL